MAEDVVWGFLLSCVPPPPTPAVGLAAVSLSYFVRWHVYFGK